jgi:hypothetical protein
VHYVEYPCTAAPRAAVKGIGPSFQDSASCWPLSVNRAPPIRLG